MTIPLPLEQSSSDSESEGDVQQVEPLVVQKSEYVLLPLRHAHFLIHEYRHSSPKIKIQPKLRVDSPPPRFWLSHPLAPSANPLGPAAQPPYLPDGQYSCRPGGERLFDLLNDMSLDGHGLLAWMAVDREEEIYELEGMADENKVIMVLWDRWIYMNRCAYKVRFLMYVRLLILGLLGRYLCLKGI